MKIEHRDRGHRGTMIEHRDPGHRRQTGGRKRRTGNSFLWPASFLVFLSAAAMGMVWLNFHYTSTWLEFETARNRNESLRSDLSSHRLALLNKARLADLNPSARERLGMTDPSVDDIRLVFLDPSSNPDGNSKPSILERIVPAAQARENGLISNLPMESPTGPEKAKHP